MSTNRCLKKLTSNFFLLFFNLILCSDKMPFIKAWVTQETNRNNVSVILDERAKFEIYYPPFVSAIEAGVGSVMCSYGLYVWIFKWFQWFYIDFKNTFSDFVIFLHYSMPYFQIICEFSLVLIIPFVYFCKRKLSYCITLSICTRIRVQMIQILKNYRTVPFYTFLYTWYELKNYRYNRIGGNFSCENADTLAGDLKTDLNFTGWVRLSGHLYNLRQFYVL